MKETASKNTAEGWRRNGVHCLLGIITLQSRYQIYQTEKMFYVWSKMRGWCAGNWSVYKHTTSSRVADAGWRSQVELEYLVVKDSEMSLLSLVAWNDQWNRNKNNTSISILKLIVQMHKLMYNNSDIVEDGQHLLVRKNILFGNS